MDSQDIINLGHKAKDETQDYINRHLNDRAKGWPKLCLCCSANAWSNQPALQAKRTLKRQT